MAASGGEPSRPARVALLLGGIIACQLLLYGPSFAGARLLLPLDLLAGDKIYLPRTPETEAIVPQNRILTDPIYSYELSRRFAARELRAGRLPLWNPYHYTGAPFAIFPKYSPFNLVYYAFPTPRSLPWMQLLQSLVAGVGAYLFFRRALELSFRPSLFAAWCYPLTGFFVLLQGFVLTYVTAWLPWMLLLADRTVRVPHSRAGPALAVVTALVLVSGQLDASAHVLIATGIYALWCMWDTSGRRRLARPAAAASARLAVAFSLGFALSAPYLLPLLEYAPSGVRLESRDNILADRPPVGLSALPEIVMPDLYGSNQEDSVRIPPGVGNRLESAAPTYAGLLAALLLAPLAWSSVRHRPVLVAFALLAVVSLAWQLDIPLVIRLFDLPILNLRPHNRFVFVASFAILSAAAVGLHALETGQVSRRRWLLVPVVLLAAVGGFAAWRAWSLPEPVATRLGSVAISGPGQGGHLDAAAVRRVQHSFRVSYAGSALLAALGLVACAGLWRRPRSAAPVAMALGGLMVGDLLWFAWGVSPQTDPALYYPRIPVLEELAARPPGRILCPSCLPPRLAETHGLSDVRGYDGVQPARLLDLLELARDARFSTPDYARTQFYVPRFEGRGGRIEVAPVLDLLNLRYAIFRGTPPPQLTPLLRGSDYWVLENPDALPRAFVPRRVETLPDERQLLWELGQADFDPAAVAYANRPVTWKQEARGRARIVDELPSRVVIDVEMETPGVLVLADLWDPGWQAQVDGHATPVLRVDHALRGVEVPVGHSQVVFRYVPHSLVQGAAAMGVGLAALVGWTAWLRRFRRS